MTTISASRYPVRWKLLALIFLAAFVLLFPWLAGQATFWSGVRQGERVNPTIAASLDVIRARAPVGAMGRAVEAIVGEHGWTSTRHDWALTERLLTAQWMTFGTDTTGDWTLRNID